MLGLSLNLDLLSTAVWKSGDQGRAPHWSLFFAGRDACPQTPAQSLGPVCLLAACLLDGSCHHASLMPCFTWLVAIPSPLFHGLLHTGWAHLGSMSAALPSTAWRLACPNFQYPVELLHTALPCPVTWPWARRTKCSHRD